MKTFILSILLLSSYANFMAKNIKGRVLDSENQPIEFANISAFVNDSIIGGCMTDSIGHFSLTAPNDCNKIRVSYIGFTDAILSPQDGNLGNIMLRQTSTTLKEVVVKAPLIRKEADRIVLNVAANPLSANKDAHELLKQPPACG